MVRRMLGWFAVGALLASAPAPADHRHHRHDDRHDGYTRVVHRTVVYRPVYRPRPPAVRYVYPHAYRYAPPRAVVHHHHHHDCGHDDYWKWVGGAVVLGEILHHAHD